MIDLPPPDTVRWVKSRKKAILDAIDREQITLQEACARYDLSEEEVQSWRHMTKIHGPDALKTTHLNRYRAKDLRTQSFTVRTEENRLSH